MTVILRLQGLSVEAGSEDIRKFFHGLLIPEGGVHITGGKTGEAFIIFTTEQDCRLAMHRSGKLLHGSPVRLDVSSVGELKQTMELNLRKHLLVKGETTSPVVTQPDLCAASVQSLVATIQGLHTNKQFNDGQFSSQTLSALIKPCQANHEILVDKAADQRHESLTEPENTHKWKNEREAVCPSYKPGYLRLYGVPDTITKQEICQFFAGLSVVDVILNAFQGQDQCCLVKMASFKDAEEGLKYSHSSLKDLCIKIRLAHERMWTDAQEQREHFPLLTFRDRISPGRSPVKRTQSPLGTPSKCHSSKSPTYETEYCVMIKNLPKQTTKTDILKMFACRSIARNKVVHLLNKHGLRTSTAFIIFSLPGEYTFAMNKNGTFIGSQKIEVSSITKKKMQELMYQSRYGDAEPSQSTSTSAQSSQSCIYARNFPANVKKTDVKDFFSIYGISEDDVTLLYDVNGNGIGEAIIRFGSRKHAKKARSLHGKPFMGEQVLLTCITQDQTKDLLIKSQ